MITIPPIGFTGRKGAAPPVVTPAVFISAAEAYTNASNVLTISAPAGIQSGDLLIAFPLSVGTGGFADISARPSSWVNKHAGFVSLEGVDSRPDCDILIAGGSEPGSYAWTYNGGAGHKMGCILLYRPAHGTQLDVIAGAVMGTATPSHTPPNVTTIQDQALIVAAYILNRQSTNTVGVSTPPSGMTNRVSLAPSSGFSRQDLGTYVYDESGPASAGLYTAEALTANGSSDGYGITVGIRALGT